MGQPQIKTDIEARVRDTGDELTGALFFVDNNKYAELFVDGQQNYCTYLSYKDSSYSQIGQIMIQKNNLLFSKYDGTNWYSYEVLHDDNIKNKVYTLTPISITPTTNVLNLGPGRYTIDGMSTAEEQEASGLPQISWHWEFFIQSTRNGTGLTDHYKTITACTYDNKIWQNALSWQAWQGWKQVVMAPASGVSGNYGININGNSATATKLLTARNFSIADNDGSNYGPTISFNGTANIILNLPSTIKAKIKGSASELEYFLTENPSNNVAGYRLLYQATPGAWANSRITLGVSSRHNGNGIVCIAFGCNNGTVSADSIYGQIIYYGNNNNASSSTGTAFTEDMFLLYYNSSTNKISLFSKYYDYSTIKINILNSYSTGGLSTITLSNFSNGAYVTSIDSATYGSQICKTTRAWVQGDSITGAVWNDYAEYRTYPKEEIPYGHCVVEVGDDTMELADGRLIPGAAICSDTFGFAIGETDECNMPIAVSGRVLAYPYEGREEFAKNIGRPVCSGPNGTVSIMSDEEYKEKGYCCVGTISAIPNYEVWGTGNVNVDGRVWISV